MSHRDEFIAGLRALAEWLKANPAAPVPPYGRDIAVYAICGDDTLGWSSVDAVADAVGLPVEAGADEVACRKVFAGGLVWRYAYITRQRAAKHAATMSYSGVVQPDTSPAGAP